MTSVHASAQIRDGSAIPVSFFGAARGRRRPARSRPTVATSGFDLESAFDAHASALLGFAVTALGDRGRAEDCVQEVFLRAWRARDRYSSARGSERTWLFAIARNVLADAMAAGRKAPVALSDADAEAVPAVSPDPLERLAVQHALAHLSDAHRDVIVAVHLRGATYAELAARTGVPIATLRTRAYHALRALRAHLDQEDTDA